MTLTQRTDIVTDYQGRIIGQFHGKPNSQALLKAFLTQVQELEDAAFQVMQKLIIAGAEGVQLDGIGQILGEERQGKADVDYRIALNATILLNVTSGTTEELIAIVDLLSGGTHQIDATPFYPASYDITVDDSVLPNGAEIGRFVTRATAAGVGGSFRWFEAAPVFRFDTGGQGLDDGLLAAAIATT